MIGANLGQVDVCTIPSLWDGTTDNRNNVAVSINAQAGDIIQVFVTLSGAGCFFWTPAIKAGDVTYLSTNLGWFADDTPLDLNTLNDRMWVSLLQSNAAQTVTFGIDHQGSMVFYPNKAPDNPGYRIKGVSFRAAVVGRNY